MLHPGSPHSPTVASRSRAGYTGQVYKTAMARDEPTYDKNLSSLIGRPLRVDSARLRCSVSEDGEGGERRDGPSAPLVL